MKQFMDWMATSFAPKMNKIARNAWIAAIQESLLTCMPVILIGSFAIIVGIPFRFVEGFPGFGAIGDFSMGLLSVFLAFLIPYNVMGKKKNRKTQREAGIAGLALFLMLCGPKFDGSGNFTLSFAKLGGGGMLAALVAGLFAGAVMNAFAKFSFFKKDTQIPDFITIWFDTLIPMLMILVAGWLTTFIFKIDMFSAIQNAFSPLVSVGDSFFGMFVIYFIGYAFFYTFGISTWLIYALESAIVLPALAENMNAVAAGGVATKINVFGMGSYLTIGGGGCTLALSVMFILLSKSKKNKLIGRTSIVPSLCNINEPLVFGAPIAFNPILMIPMWIVGFLAPLMTYLALYFNLVPRVSVLWSFWYLPSPFGAFYIGGMRGILLMLAVFSMAALVYYPFFKIYDKQCAEQEATDAAKAKQEAAADA